MVIRSTDDQPGGRVAGLPEPPTAFVGREDEIAALVEMLENPACRLVTLLGPGGAGKTRLAVEAARRWAGSTGVETAFVSLESAAGPEALAPEIAGALEIRGLGESPVDDLARMLAERELLLVLDNFENVNAGAPMLSRLLEGAPGVSLLVTSREALNLSSEWRYTVRGLPVPGEGQDGAGYASVELFSARAQQLDPKFSLQDEMGEVARICRLVEGMPLAIELAASWTSSLTCAEIANEIASRMDFLTTNRRDIPERHRSVQAVFDQCWQRLSEEERLVFARLSAFRGGFDREAASKVAGAGLPVLTSFVDRSLIWKDAEGRFRVHELLSQCAREHFRERPDVLGEANARHTDHYFGLAERMLAEMLTGDQVGAARMMAREHDNVMAAFLAAMGAGRVEGLMAAEQALVIYLQFSGRYGEGIRVLESALPVIESWEPTEEVCLAMAQLCVDLGWFYVRVGRMRDAEALAERGREAYAKAGAPIVRGAGNDPELVSATVALVEGRYTDAERLASRALQTAEGMPHAENIPYAHFALAEAARGLGQAEEALERSRRALETAGKVNDRWFEAYVLNQLGTLLAATGDRAGARKRFEESYQIRHEFGDPEGMAVALNGLGDLALREGDHAQALRIFEESRRLYRDLDDVGGRATTLRGLGEACTGLGRYGEAAAHLRQALADVASIRFAGALPSLAEAVAGLLSATGNGARAAGIRGRAGREPAEGAAIESLVAELDAALAAVKPPSGTRGTALAEPLTERELEVLRCIADGKSNREIAEGLVLSVGTVKAHTHNIYGKLGADNRVQAVARAREAGLL